MIKTLVLQNATVIDCTGQEPYSNASVIIENGRILKVGSEKSVTTPRNAQLIDVSGKVVMPRLIDCHTHLVYGGSRATEFELRLNGASYEEIARSGGGILSTVTATRNASEDELLAQSLPRLDAFLAEGVATIEIKSGYGLDIETEIKMLRLSLIHI